MTEIIVSIRRAEHVGEVSTSVEGYLGPCINVFGSADGAGVLTIYLPHGCETAAERIAEGFRMLGHAPLPEAAE